MQGSIKKRTYTRTNRAGKRTTRTVWRARYLDPTKPASASAKIEKGFATKQEAQAWLARQAAERAERQSR